MNTKLELVRELELIEEPIDVKFRIKRSLFRKPTYVKVELKKEAKIIYDVVKDAVFQFYGPEIFILDPCEVGVDENGYIVTVENRINLLLNEKSKNTDIETYFNQLLKLKDAIKLTNRFLLSHGIKNRVKLFAVTKKEKKLSDDLPNKRDRDMIRNMRLMNLCIDLAMSRFKEKKIEFKMFKKKTARK
jgi:hypothetical protein